MEISVYASTSQRLLTDSAKCSKDGNYFLIMFIFWSSFFDKFLFLNTRVISAILIKEEKLDELIILFISAEKKIRKNINVYLKVGLSRSKNFVLFASMKAL